MADVQNKDLPFEYGKENSLRASVAMTVKYFADRFLERGALWSQGHALRMPSQALYLLPGSFDPLTGS
jgi:hypothetical protein